MHDGASGRGSGDGKAEEADIRCFLALQILSLGDREMRGMADDFFL